MKLYTKFTVFTFIVLTTLNLIAPAYVNYFVSTRNSVVYAQDQVTTDPSATGGEGGAESVSAGISCYDSGPKEKGFWDKVSDVANNDFVQAATLGSSTAVGWGAQAADKVGGVIDFAKNPLKWFVCGVSGLMTGAINFLNKTLNRLMLFDPTKNNDEVNKAYKADCATSSIDDKNCTSFTSLGAEGTNNLKKMWRNVLNISNIFLIIGFLIMIISTALDMSFFSSYTVKKVLPKIIIAAIAANLSWIICSTVISGVNYVGIGIQSVMVNPYTASVDSGLKKGLDATSENAAESTANDAVNQGGTIFQGAVAASIGTIVFAIFASAGAILLPILAFVLLAMIIAFVVFLVRRIIIILLVIAAPLAFMAWAIPGGEQWFKKWWKAFTQVLFVYPYAMILFGAGIMISGVIGQTNPGDDGAIGDIINAFLMIIALLLPYFMLPTAFKMVGGALGTITGKINDSSKGLIDRAKTAKDNSNYGRAKARKKEIKQAQKQRGFEESLQAGGALGTLRRRQAYGGAGLNPWRREANRDYTEALKGQATDKYDKEQREIQKIKFDQRAKANNWTQEDVLNNAQEQAKHGKTMAERNAAKDILVDFKDETRLRDVQDHARASGDERAAEHDQFTSSRHGDIKAFASHLTTETRGENGHARSQADLDAARVNTMSDATPAVKSTQKASGVEYTAAMDSSGKILQDFTSVSKNDNLNGNLDQNILPKIQAAQPQAAASRDIADAVKQGMAGAPSGIPNLSGANVSNQDLAGAATETSRELGKLMSDLRSAATNGGNTASIQANIDIHESAANHINTEIQRRNNLPPPTGTP